MNMKELSDRLDAVMHSKKFNEIDIEIAITGVACDYFRSLHQLEGALKNWNEALAKAKAERKLLLDLMR